MKKKKLLRWSFLGLLMMVSLLSKAQTIKGYVEDKDTKQPLAGVNVFVDGTLLGTATDENGYYSLDVKAFPIVITFSFIGYESEKKTLTALPRSLITTYLTERASILPEIAVYAKPKVDTVYASGYSVIDYEFYDDYIILLVYRNVFARYALLLIDEAGNELNEKSLKGMKPERLGKTCLGGIYLFTSVFAHQIYIEELEIKFSYREDILLFEDYMNPCMAANMDLVYFKDTYYQNQYIQYYALNRDGSSDSKRNIAVVLDEQKITMAIDESNFQRLRAYLNAAHKQGVYEESPYGETGSMPQIDEGDLTFIQKILYKPIFAPIFLSADTLFLFNHVTGLVQKLSVYGDLIDEVPIEYHQDKKWRKELVFDEEQRRAYTLFDTQQGWAIANIGLENGNLGEPIVFDRPFVEKIKAKDGYVYFLFRNPRVNDRIRKLEKIRVY